MVGMHRERETRTRIAMNERENMAATTFIFSDFLEPTSYLIENIN